MPTPKTENPSEYCRWLSMIARCHNPKNQAFKNYGGRGITVCDRWRASLDAFLADMGRVPAPGLTLDRIDNNGNYEPGNVAWRTRKEQRHNRRPVRPFTKRSHSFSLKITWDGKTQSIYRWAKETGMTPSTVWCRYVQKGWPAEQTLTTPIGATRRKKTQIQGTKRRSRINISEAAFMEIKSSTGRCRDVGARHGVSADYVSKVRRGLVLWRPPGPRAATQPLLGA